MKTLQELKRAIQNKQLEDSLIVLKWTDFSFIAFEYLEAIANFKHLDIRWIENFDNLVNHIDDNLFDFSNIDYLQVYVTDKFTTKSTQQLEELKNVIIVCKEVDSNILEFLKDKEYYFEIPKLQEWQILDYLKQSCKGLSAPKIKWLYDISGGNIYRLDNEIKKISCFNEKIQNEVFDIINDDNGYDDMTQNKIYDLTNAVLSKDLKQVAIILKDIKNMDVEGVGLVTILRKSFKLVIGIQLDRDASPEKLGIKATQFNVVRAKNCNKFNENKLKSIYKFLVEFDYNLKSGNLDMSKDRLIDYIICEVLS